MHPFKKTQCYFTRAGLKGHCVVYSRPSASEALVHAVGREADVPKNEGKETRQFELTIA